MGRLARTFSCVDSRCAQLRRRRTTWVCRISRTAPKKGRPAYQQQVESRTPVSALRGRGAASRPEHGLSSSRIGRNDKAGKVFPPSHCSSEWKARATGQAAIGQFAGATQTFKVRARQITPSYLDAVTRRVAAIGQVYQSSMGGMPIPSSTKRCGHSCGRDKKHSDSSSGGSWDNSSSRMAAQEEKQSGAGFGRSHPDCFR